VLSTLTVCPDLAPMRAREVIAHTCAPDNVCSVARPFLLPAEKVLGQGRTPDTVAIMVHVLMRACSRNPASGFHLQASMAAWIA
jgi:hypothetical protein